MLRLKTCHPDFTIVQSRMRRFKSLMGSSRLDLETVANSTITFRPCHWKK